MHLAVSADRGEALAQGRQHLLGKRVARLWAIEREHGDAADVLPQKRRFVRNRTGGGLRRHAMVPKNALGNVPSRRCKTARNRWCVVTLSPRIADWSTCHGQKSSQAAKQRSTRPDARWISPVARLATRAPVVTSRDRAQRCAHLGKRCVHRARSQADRGIAETIGAAQQAPQS